jgi:hypothetical protein
MDSIRSGVGNAINCASLRGLVVAGLMAGIAGCATGVDRIALLDPMAPMPDLWTHQAVESGLAYQTPQAKEDALVVALVRLDDDRPDISTMGTQSNTWGQKMGTVELVEGLIFKDVFFRHLQSCFRSCGFELVNAYEGALNGDASTRDAVAEVRIRNFWTEFMPGVFVVDAASKVQFELEILTPDGQTRLYANTFQGEGKVSGAAIVREMSEKSLNMAHRQAMNALHEELQGTIRDLLATGFVALP